MTKSEEEIREILKRKEARLQEKAERRRMQEQNIAFKDEKREENNTLKGMKRKWQKEEAASDNSEVEDTGMQEDQPEAEESEDEAEYYRQAVWEEPDEDMFPSLKRKHGPGKSSMPFKKRKLSTEKAGDKKSRFKCPFSGRKFGGKKWVNLQHETKDLEREKWRGSAVSLGKAKGERGLKEKKSGPHSSKGKGQRPKIGSGFKAGQRGGHGKKDFKKKKEKR